MNDKKKYRNAISRLESNARSSNAVQSGTHIVSCSIP